MNTARSFRWLVIVIIIGFMIASGPIVPSIDFTTAPVDNDNATNGMASIEIISPPSDSVRIEPGRFGTGYYLIVPEITLKIRTIRGMSTLIYEIVVPGISKNSAKLVFLDQNHEGRSLTFKIDRLSVAGSKIDSDSYPGVISVRIRSGNKTRTVMQKNTTISVQNYDES